MLSGWTPRNGEWRRKVPQTNCGSLGGAIKVLFPIPIQKAVTATWSGTEESVALGTAERGARDSLLGSTGPDS